MVTLFEVFCKDNAKIKLEKSTMPNICETL